jgi:uncharacterized membrane protein
LFNQTLMKLPDVYSDWRIMAGFALIVLGTVNWVVGRSRTQEYSRIAVGTANVPADEAYRSFDEIDPGNDSAVLAPFTNAQRQVSYATARMDFYHATFLTGRALVLAGVVLTLLGFIAIIQRDNRHVHRRLRVTPRGNAPPLRPH